METREHSDELVLSAQRYIEKHSGDDLSLVELSMALYISDRQLNHSFIKALQCSPTAYPV